jgi:predicted Zn-dependent protease
VYVTSYDGGQFNTELMPEDRAAISHVEDAIQKWGKLILVYRSQEADIILAVQSRPSEDVLAVYEAHRGDAGSRPSETYLWRVMGRGGLQKSEMPLFSQFEKAWEQIAK